MAKQRLPSNTARWPYVVALGAFSALGGGYAAHQTYLSTDEAALIAHMRDGQLDCLQHQIDTIRGGNGGR